MDQVFRNIKMAFIKIDRVIEAIALSAVGLMTLIVIVQVFTRKLFNLVFFWSEEITLLLLVWITFLGIAIGFREKLHLAMDAFARRLPTAFNKALDKVIGLSTFLFGVYLIRYGGPFAVLMHNNTMPATEWPSSIMYFVMPVTGVLVCFYSALQLFGIHTARHEYLEEETTE
ncbi:TRAP transporter small permease [Paenibacillus tarimensis]